MLQPSHPFRYFISYHLRLLKHNLHKQLILNRLATSQSTELLPHVLIEHKSPILRKLQGVDEQLQINKRQNLNLVLPKIQNLLIEPKQIFSFWHLAQKPSQQRGFLEGLIIQSGRPAKGIGGGLCQLSNALFWCALHTDLIILERHRHSFDIFPDDRRQVPFGLGAAVAYGIKDLRFENNNTARYQILVSIQNDDLCVTIRSSLPQPKYRVEERNSHFYQRDGKVYRKNQVVRIDITSGQEEILFNNDYECRYLVPTSQIQNLV